MKTVQDFKCLIYNKSEEDSDIVRNFLKVIEGEIWPCEDEKTMGDLINQAKEKYNSKEVLILKPFKGRIFQDCPGSPGMICCNYRLLNTCFGCLYNCAYCFLQLYLNSYGITQFTNIDDLAAEVIEAKKKIPRTLVRVGTGEFTDSLMMDEVTGIAESLIYQLKDHKDIILEFKTKSDHIDHLLDVREKGNSVIAWSVSTPKNIAAYEEDTATLDRRLSAASRAVQSGYYTAFHFDPVIMYEGFIEDYFMLIDDLCRAVDPDKVLWISLGGVRFLRSFKEIVRKNFPDERMTLGEFFPGEDGKMRYLRPVRMEFYKKLVDRLRKKFPKTYIYFCMEPTDVWQEIMGLDFQTSDDLEFHFMQHLIQMLD